MIDTQELTRTADILQLLSYYGITPNRAGFIRCISHNDSRPSMKVYPRTNSVHCFVCGADYNSIGFVQAIEKCSFLRACNILKAIFGISDDRRNQASIRRKMQAIADEKRRQKEAEQARNREWIALCDLKHDLERMYYEILPGKVTEEFMADDAKIDAAMKLGLEIIKIDKKLEGIRNGREDIT